MDGHMPLKLSKDGHLRFACLMMAGGEGKSGKEVVSDALSFYDFITARSDASARTRTEAALSGPRVIPWSGSAPKVL